jgi:hypothetical protein
MDVWDKRQLNELLAGGVGVVLKPTFVNYL